MENIMYVGLFLSIVCLAGMFIKVTCDFEDYREQTAYEKLENDKRMAELEKEVRILKMDSYINTNGFEGGVE